MLNLVVGRQGSGKSTVIYKQIKKCLDKGEDNLILIVPEQFTLQAERNLIEQCNLPGIFNIEILSFSRLANRVMSEVGGVTKTRLSETGRYMALQKSLIERKDDLLVYPGMIKKPGFIAMIQDVISNLKRRVINEEDISKLLSEGLGDHQMLYRKIHDLKLIYQSYNKWLGTDYLDNEDAIDQNIKNIERSNIISSSKIWIDGFHTYTEQHFRLIEKLFKYSMELTIALTQSLKTNDRDADIFQINNNTQNTLIEMSNGQYKIISCHYLQKHNSQEIRHLEKELYSYPTIELNEKVEDISIKKYKNIYDEIDSICIDILKLVQEKKYRWRDISVVTNDLDSYSFLIKRTFKEYDIPFFMDSKRKISDKPLSILLVSTLKVITSNFRYDDIFALIKTGLTDLEFEDYELLENYVLKYGIKGNRWRKEFEFIDERDDFDLDKLNLLRVKVMGPILQLERDIKGDSTYIGITSALYKYVRTLEIEDKLHNVIYELKEEYNQYEYASEISQIFNIIVSLFDEIVEIFKDHKTNIKEYISILEAGIEAVDLAIIPSSLDQVIIGDITRSRNSGYNALFILGVNEGKLPSSPSVTGILNESENQIIRQNGIKIDDDLNFKSIQEKYLFYNVISKTKKKIFISYPLADYEGVSLRPSILVSRFYEIYPDLSTKIEISDDEKINNAQGSLKHMIRHYRIIADGLQERKESKWDEVYLWYKNNKNYSDNIINMKRAISFDNQVSNLKSKYVSELYGDRIRTSVTRLEEYVSCPFKHYITFGLKPKERKIFEISIPDIGDILHKLIYDYSILLEKENLDWNIIEKNNLIKLCDEVMDKFIIEYRHGILDSNYRYRYLAKYVHRLFLRAVETLTYQYRKGKFTILGNELIFGIDKPLPPIKIELSGKYMLFLEGRIDRVDILKQDEKQYLKIIDFKTGNKDLILKDIYYGLSLQLLVYMWVCLNYGNKKNIETVAAGLFYFKLDDPLILSGKNQIENIEYEITKSLKLKGLMLKDKEMLKSLDENIENSDILNCKIKKDGEFSATSKGLIKQEQVDQLIYHAEKTITNIGEEIFQGNISISPIKTKDKEACTYCNYKAICFFDQQLAGSKFNLKPELKDEEVMKLIETAKEE
ncbi:helicase-exonuclease AddAB subunit AddB [Alkalibaculum sporogenes]|uniref:helicase-exonuclease AddAB subunit AddB n=1 Tax=Alkalibaculum sporogenes TaxID=2655001 RepID=UPI00187BC326